MHMMLDLETAGNGAKTVVLSAGMVLFDPFHELTPFSDLIVETRYWVFPFDEQLKIGREVTPSTLVWWMEQSADAQKALKESVEYTGNMYESVSEIVNYARESKAVWGNGAAFDNTIMRSLSQGLGTKEEWPWVKDACYRTIANLARAKAGTSWYPKENRGIHHNALDDAIWQATALRNAFKVLGITSYGRS